MLVFPQLLTFFTVCCSIWTTCRKLKTFFFTVGFKEADIVQSSSILVCSNMRRSIYPQRKGVKLKRGVKQKVVYKVYKKYTKVVAEVVEEVKFYWWILIENFYRDATYFRFFIATYCPICSIFSLATSSPFKWRSIMCSTCEKNQHGQTP